MSASTKRALSLIFSAGLVVASLFIYATLISPEYADVKNLRGELSSKSNLLNNQKISIDQVTKLFAQYQSAAKLGESLSLALPEDESISSIMAQINAISQASGLAVQSVGLNYLPAKPAAITLTSAKGIGSLKLDLKLSGPYSGFKNFLQSLETNIRIMDMQSLKIDPAQSSAQSRAGSQDYFNFTLSVITYYQAN